MKLNAIQVAGLQAEAKCGTTRPDNCPEGTALGATYSLGVLHGRSRLAQELLQAEDDRRGNCPRGCQCPSCNSEPVDLRHD